ncbi:P-loop containing nucleoside triphosphate hydrolase protein [Mycena pura]|uniref:DNA 3'-5' helicase n=1 Tax=Mycena pura TaxID=153505 RepID=A0AAD6Y8R7_9AGAR|nr:P-loop containing nucleoside triphosphate hydrolase protein [Mycena pura]
MNNPDTLINPILSQWLEFARQLSLPDLEAFARANIPANLPLPATYLNSLDNDYKTIALRACILVFIASNKRMIPRQYQLEASNATAHGLDCTIDSGTGSGKTLCQIILNLLYPNTTSITISPLKRLQILQAAEFERWGIKVACINEDTPSDRELWDCIRDGFYQHLIVQPEQLKIYQGHLPRLARLLHNQRFLKTIARVHVDEAHNHYLAGLPQHGLPPFRPAWGALDEFRLRLPKGTPFQALSGTLPPHIKLAIHNHLNFDPTRAVSLKLSSNRPNIVYATHRIVGSLKDFRNADFLISIPYKPVIKSLIFHDNTEQCAGLSDYLDERLPLDLRKTGIVRHYHSGMSKEYLTQVFEDFCKPNGGLDVSDVEAVVDYGLPQKMSTSQQRGGRGGRRGQLAVYLVMAEPWAFTAALDSVVPDGTDPDRPICGRLTKTTPKAARAGLAMILYVRSEVCLRTMISQYLADRSTEALSISFGWCCDRPHPERPEIQFDKRTFFPGRFIYEEEDGAIYAGDVGEPDRVHLNPPVARKRKPRGVSNRKTEQRAPLQSLIRTWLSKAHSIDPLRAVRPASFILDAKGINKLSTVHPDRIKTVGDVAAALGETEEWMMEWGAQIIEIITNYDTDIHVQSTERPAPAKRGKVQETNIEYEPRAKRAKITAVLTEANPNVRRSTRKTAKSK